MQWLKHLFTRCVSVSGDDGPYRGTLHVHAGPFSQNVREIIFVPPHGKPFAVDADTLSAAMEHPDWADAVAIFHLNR